MDAMPVTPWLLGTHDVPLSTCTPALGELTRTRPAAKATPSSSMPPTGCDQCAPASYVTVSPALVVTAIVAGEPGANAIAVPVPGSAAGVAARCAPPSPLSTRRSSTTA